MLSEERPKFALVLQNYHCEQAADWATAHTPLREGDMVGTLQFRPQVEKKGKRVIAKILKAKM